jgi:hypothetical protein
MSIPGGHQIVEQIQYVHERCVICEQWSIIERLGRSMFLS